jgi:predicted DNA-binding transcriptional regulator YafY
MELRFGPLERRGLLQQILAGSPHGLSIRDLTRILKDRGQRITEKTVRRMVDALLTESGAIEELEPEDGTRGRRYRMKRGYKPDTIVNLSPDEIEALYFASGMMHPLRNTPQYASLTSLLTKLDALAPERSRKRLKHLRQNFEFEIKETLAEEIKPGIFNTLIGAIQDGFEVEGIYKSSKSDQPNKRLLGAETLFLHNGNTYLLASDQGTIKTFALRRFKSVTLRTDRPYRKQGIKAEDWFKDSIGIQTDGPVKDLHLTVKKEFADFVLERRFHPSQKTKRNSDGTLTLSLRVVINEELVAWVMGFGDNLVKCDV